jgi:hypothetical protein
MPVKFQRALPGLLLGLLLSSGTAETLWTEGFEGTFPPEGWIENSVDQSTTRALAGTKSAQLGAASDYLITPQLTHADTLIFWTYTTSADPEIVVSLSIDPPDSWNEVAKHVFSGFTDDWAGQSIDLRTYDSVYVRFQKSGTGTLYIDEVSLEDGTVSSNRPPVIDPIEDQTVFEGEALEFSVTASDPVDNDPVSLSATGLPVGAVFTNGTFRWNPSAPIGTYSIIFTATDKDGSVSETGTVHVIEKPLLLISEVADPAGTGGGDFRFVELYNAGETPVDLATDGWHLCRQVNGASWRAVPLTGIVPAGTAYVVAKNEADFAPAYDIIPDQADSAIDGNGDDAYGLFYNGDHESGVLIDLFGELDTDGTGTDWEYTDSRAERIKTVLEPNRRWTAAEWNIAHGAVTDDMTPGEHGPTPEFENLQDRFVFEGTDLEMKVTAANTVRPDRIILSASALPEGALFELVSGNDRVSGMLRWSRPAAGVYSITFSATGAAGTTVETITLTVGPTSQIDGFFRGWENDSILKLRNGQFWKNLGGVGPSVDLYNPVISVTDVLQTGTLVMTINGVSGRKEVRQIDVVETTVTGAFDGLRYGRVYELADGSAWEQTGFETAPASDSTIRAWRWTENSTTFLRFLTRDNDVLDTTTVVPAGSPVNPPVTARLEGWFRGWENGRVFALSNGEVWRQNDPAASAETLYRPSVTLTNVLQTGLFRMRIDGTASPPEWIEVRRLTNVVRTAVAGRFYGFARNRFIKLQNGAWWRQTSAEQSDSVRNSPAVLIWDDGGTDRLELPDEGRSVIAEQLHVIGESAVTNAFSGLRYGTLYQLADGSSRLQVSFENIPRETSGPSVMLWNEAGRTRMLLRSADGEEIGDCTVVDPAGDDDRDGQSNADEITAGSDPLQAQSVFAVSRTGRDAQGRIVLYWDAVEERIYSVEWTPSLAEPFQTLEESILWPQNSWTNRLHTVEPAGFYRLRVRRL